MVRKIHLRQPRRKTFKETNVLDAARERIVYLYACFDRVFVGFSGGKDSTAVLNLTLEVAAKLGKLPLDVVFFDEEAIAPTTVEYVERVRNDPRVRLQWYCMEFKHRNACSNDQPYWTCWNAAERAKWVRPMPSFAITSHPRWVPGMSYQEFNDAMHSPEMGNVVNLTGVRAEESMRRTRAVMAKRNDNYITHGKDHPHVAKAHPIYDWKATDVWKYVAESGCDYNRTYDIINRTKFYQRFGAQRVCQPFGEEPLRSLWLYAECFPDTWHKILGRVEGVATAWRYANTELYGQGEMGKPEGMSWRDFLESIYDTYPPEWRAKVRQNVSGIVKNHYSKTDYPIPDVDSHPLTGVSWHFLCKIAAKGDFKGRTSGRLKEEAIKAQKKIGINSYPEALARFGKPGLKVIPWK